MERSPVAKVSPACSFVWIWLMLGKTYSTGSSIVMTLRVCRDLGQGGVERGRLAASGRSGAQHHAERSSNEVGVGVGGVVRHAEFIQAKNGPGPVEEPHDALLAPDGGDGGNAHVDFLAVDLRPQLAVLGPATLDDVHPGHDLDPADQADAHGRREGQDLFQGAVDPVADPEATSAARYGRRKPGPAWPG